MSRMFWTPCPRFSWCSRQRVQLLVMYLLWSKWLCPSSRRANSEYLQPKSVTVINISITRYSIDTLFMFIDFLRKMGPSSGYYYYSFWYFSSSRVEHWEKSSFSFFNSHTIRTPLLLLLLFRIRVLIIDKAFTTHQTTM